jgi:hypothetical protein
MVRKSELKVGDIVELSFGDNTMGVFNMLTIEEGWLTLGRVDSGRVMNLMYNPPLIYNKPNLGVTYIKRVQREPIKKLKKHGFSKR